MAYCNNCGHFNPDGSKFCGNCGKNLENENNNKQTNNEQKEHHTRKSIIDSINEYVGNDKPADINCKVLFSDVFKPHTTEEAEEIRKSGRSVSTMKKIPQKLKSREVVYLRGGENA